MDYEKKFKDAFERAKKVIEYYKGHHRCDEASIEDLESIFPELKESEDEKIRKELLESLKYQQRESRTDKEWLNGIKLSEVVAWLEKQGEKHQYWKPSKEQLNALDYAYNSCPDTERGNYYEGVLASLIDDLHKLSEKQEEQKPIDKVEPKFKVGDWVVDNYGSIWKIEGILNQFYLLEGIGEGESRPTIEWANNQYHLWTLKDAKDGDVLASNNGNTFIYHKHDNNYVYYHCSINYFDNITINSSWNVLGIKPATKEQRDLLFQKMKEAGYEWDAKKKELKKIHNALEECEIENIEHGKYYYCIKDYFCGGRKQASKGDVVQALRGMSMMALGVKANEYFLPVNSIKQNHAWSKEDDSKIESICRLLKTRFDKDTCDEVGFTRDKMCDYLSSLKNKIQPQWKPSDEQMHYLSWIANIKLGESVVEQEVSKRLNELYEDLKKLKG